jgi:nucleoside-diphosphate-sugar epimerase
MDRILVTGASGFLGSNLIRYFDSINVFKTYALLRRSINMFDNEIVVENLSSDTNLTEHIKNIDCIVHCAALTNLKTFSSDEYRKTNVDLSLSLAKQALECGVKRFIFISSIKVNGESTLENESFRFDDVPSPADAYGFSKCEAEIALTEIIKGSNMELTIIRSPLIYGKFVKGNFESLIKLIHKRLPLPLAGINNKRSMVSIQNLVNLISVCVNHPNAANKTFLVSDDHDLSISELLIKLGNISDRPARLFKCPLIVLKVFALLFGKINNYNSLTGSLQVDISFTKETLNWFPPVSIDVGLKNCFINKNEFL